LFCFDCTWDEASEEKEKSGDFHKSGRDGDQSYPVSRRIISP
jgi:hypothetical protein